MSDSVRIVKAHCNACRGERNHSVVAERKQEDDDENSDGSYGFWECTIYEMLQCCGCENITLRSSYTCAGSGNEVMVSYYPPAITRHKPEWLSGSSAQSFRWHHSELNSLLDEVYAALHAGSNRLAIMGARTLIDMVMLDKIGDQGTFDDKLKTMETTGYLSRTNREFLKQAINAGSAAAHRGHQPDDQDVNRVMDIVENFIQAVYFLETAAVKLQQNTPPRSPKAQ